MRPSATSIFLSAVLLLAVFSSACTRTDEPEMPEQMPLVVEGWIEEGEAPVVIVTHALDLTQDSVKLEDAIERWCRVSVYDNGERNILYGKVNPDYTPSLIYTLPRMEGEVGHTYRLVVETEEQTVTAEATMLPAPRLTRLVAEKSEKCDTLYSIRAYAEGVEKDGIYKFFACSRSLETRFYPTFLGTFKGSEYNPATGWTITRGLHSGYDKENFTHEYASGDRVTVRLCSIQPDLYQFWKNYDSNISLSGNLFFSFAENCVGNIEGGLGYWGVYGCSEMSIRIP